MNPFTEKLQQFVDDEVMFNAVRAMFLSHCDLNEASKHISFEEVTNEQIGELVRGWEQAREIVTLTFKDMEKYKKRDKRTDIGKNPAV